MTVAKKAVKSAATTKAARNGAPSEDGTSAREVLVADIIIKNAPDPVFVSDLEGKILQANDAVSQLLGFRQDEVVEQSLSRFISAEETREFTAALREVVAHGVTRNAVLNPRSASGELIPTTPLASSPPLFRSTIAARNGAPSDDRTSAREVLVADIIIENAPDPVFVS